MLPRKSADFAASVLLVGLIFNAVARGKRGGAGASLPAGVSRTAGSV
jgi:hypothetical protein